jgi:hypothetical protein
LALYGISGGAGLPALAIKEELAWPLIDEVLSDMAEIKREVVTLEAKLRKLKI